MKTLLTTAVAATTATGLLFAGTPAANARPAVQPRITSISVKPVPVVLSGKKAPKLTYTKLKVEVRTQGAVQVVTKAAHRKGIGHGSVIFETPGAKQTPPGSGIWTNWGEISSIDEAGTYVLTVSAYGDGADDETETTATFQVRRSTYFSGFKPHRKKVRKGRTVSLSGRLNGLNSLGRYAPYKGGKVHIYFRRPNSGKWVWIAATVTGRNGRFAKGIKVNKTGLFMVRFNGNGTWYKSASLAKRVTVVR